MSMNERIYKIDQLLSERTAIAVDELLEHLEVSKATLKRDLAYMRDRLHAPIVFDKELGGYRFDRDCKNVGTPYELPGLWFSPQEIHALLTMHHLLSNLDGSGLLGGHIQALQSRLAALLSSANDSLDEVKRRIKLEMIRVRHVELNHFEEIGSALLKRNRLLINYYSRGSNQKTQREVSPQRMIFYHGNWYLDGWCHMRDNLRSFAIDTIERVEILDKKAKDVSEKVLDEHLTTGYGIFAGKKVQWATLLFAPNISRWVSRERWHKDQKGTMREDGSFELKVPYSNDTELLMDILRYGADVKVLAPPSLIKGVTQEISKLNSLYD